MTLRDLLKKCRYKDVFNIIHQEYYKGTEADVAYGADLGYRKVYQELRLLPEAPNAEYKINITEREDEEFIDVCLYCNEDEETYAMDFTPWTELIDAKIKNDTKMEDINALSHILWEITFYGYDAEGMQLEKDKLEQQIERIEGGQEKLIPWEDGKKELDIDEEN